MRVLIALIALLTIMIILPSQAQASNWQPLPHNCHDPTIHEYLWWENDVLYGSIQGSLGCRALQIDRDALPIDADVVSLHTEMYVTTVNADRNIYISYVDEDNLLGLHFYSNNAHVDVMLNGNPGSASRSSFPVDLNMNAWNTIGIRHDRLAGKMVVTINGQTTVITGINTGHVGQPALGLSVGANRYSSVRYRSILWQEEDVGNYMDVISFSQKDALWGGDLYNQATTWAAWPTMKHWGCAVTSAAMVLKYYDHNQLPDGSSLHPGALNEWLKQQPDGYLGQGLLNWRAITRLTKLNHDLNNSFPIISFLYHGSDLAWLYDQLSANVPVILEQPGHFIVATGWGPSEATIAINDPAHPYKLLSSYNNNFQSARLPKIVDGTTYSISLMTPKSLLVKQNEQIVLPHYQVGNNDLYEWENVSDIDEVIDSIFVDAPADLEQTLTLIVDSEAPLQEIRDVPTGRNSLASMLLAQNQTENTASSRLQILKHKLQAFGQEWHGG